MLARSANGIIAGVCGGVAKRLDLEPWLVRFLFVCSIFFFGSGLFLYLLLAISLPREDRLDHAYDKKIMGVCSVISRRADLDVGLTRFLALLILFTSCGWAIFAYVILYFALPSQSIKAKAESQHSSSAQSLEPLQNEVSSKTNN